MSLLPSAAYADYYHHAYYHHHYVPHHIIITPVIGITTTAELAVARGQVSPVGLDLVDFPGFNALWSSPGYGLRTAGEYGASCL